MGTGMASRLLSQGFAVTVYNRSAAKAQALQQSGARVAATPREAADGAALILSMLADDVAARDVDLARLRHCIYAIHPVGPHKAASFQLDTGLKKL